MKSVGEILKSARKRKKVSLEEASEYLRIHSSLLQALEESDYSKFSNEIQLKGFLKNYSRYLDLDKDQVLAFWRREYNGKRHKDEQLKSLKGVRINRFVVTPSLVITSITLFLIALFSFYVFVQYRSYMKPPLLDVQSPATDMSTDSLSLDIFGKTDSDATLKLNGQKVLVNNDGSFAVTVSLSSGVNVLTFVSSNQLGRKNTVTRKVLVDRMGVGEGGNDRGLTISIEILDKATRISVTTDSKKVFDGIVLSGVKMSFSAQNSIEVSAENAGVVKVAKDGEDLGLLGEKGRFAQKLYTKQ